MPTCTKCRVELVKDDNWSRGAYSRNFRRCRACKVNDTTAWREANPGKARAARKRYRRTPTGRFSSSKTNAKSRGLSWSLTSDQFEALSVLPCRYCGCPPAESTGSSLDRINNRIGYVHDNVVPCCWQCNHSRGDSFSYDEMINFIGPAIKAVRERRHVEAVLHGGVGSAPAVPGTVLS